MVWIADFGLAKGHDEGLTQSGDILGTLRYMPPERLRGEGDARADVYALGMTLYELLTLRTGFASSDRLRLIDLIKTEEPLKPGDRRADSAQPGDNRLEGDRKGPQGAVPVGRGDGRGPRAVPRRRADPGAVVSALERAGRWCRRNPGLATATALSVVALVATAVIALAYGVQQGHFASADTGRRARAIAAEDLRGPACRVALKEGVSLCEQNEVGQGLLWLTRALEFAGADQPELQREIRLNIDRWSRGSPLALREGIPPARERRGGQSRWCRALRR